MPAEVEVPTDALEMGKQYIAALTTAFDHTKYADHYREALLDLINQKAEALPKPEIVPSAPSTLPNLMEALHKAVESTRKRNGKATKRPQAEVTAWNTQFCGLAVQHPPRNNGRSLLTPSDVVLN